MRRPNSSLLALFSALVLLLGIWAIAPGQPFAADGDESSISQDVRDAIAAEIRAELERQPRGIRVAILDLTEVYDAAMQADGRIEASALIQRRTIKERSDKFDDSIKSLQEERGRKTVGSPEWIEMNMRVVIENISRKNQLEAIAKAGEGERNVVAAEIYQEIKWLMEDICREKQLDMIIRSRQGSVAKASDVTYKLLYDPVVYATPPRPIVPAEAAEKAEGDKAEGDKAEAKKKPAPTLMNGAEDLTTFAAERITAIMNELREERLANMPKPADKEPSKTPTE